MTLAETTEAAGLVRSVTDALMAAVQDATSVAAADLRREVGILDVASRMSRGDLGTALFECFDLARKAGASLSGMARVRLVATATSPVSPRALGIQVGVVRFGLIQEARIIAATTFRSRDDVDRIQARMTEAFSAAAELAADAGAAAVFRSLTTLQASVTRDLQQRARPLPRLNTFTFGASMPAIVIANRLYGDADRADEIAAENQIVHPLFAGLRVRALSA